MSGMFLCSRTYCCNYVNGRGAILTVTHSRIQIRICLRNPRLTLDKITLYRRRNIATNLKNKTAQSATNENSLVPPALFDERRYNLQAWAYRLIMCYLLAKVAVINPVIGNI